MAGFTEEQRGEIFSRDNYRCQKCGSGSTLQTAHVIHRKLGGDEEKNYIENGITFCAECHDNYDSGQFSIEKWDPSDKENGLRIVRNFAQRDKEEEGLSQVVSKDELYFYQIPSERLIEEAHKVDKRIKEAQQVESNAKRAKIAHLQEIRDRKVDGKPLYEGIPKADAEDDETYSSFEEYIKLEILPSEPQWNSLKTAKNYVSAHRALKPGANDLIGVYLAFDKPDLEKDILEKMRVTDPDGGKEGIVEETIERDKHLIVRVIKEEQWEKFKEGEIVEFENGERAEIIQVESELEQIDLGNFSDLASVVRDNSINEEEKRRLVESAKGSQEDFKKQKRNIKTGDNGKASRMVSCKQCETPELASGEEVSLHGEDIKLGDRAKICEVSGMEISSMSGHQAQRVGEDMDERFDCFKPRD